jgi:hypothetical protein
MRFVEPGRAHGAALALGLLPIEHREDRPGEIGRGICQLVCAGTFKFVSGPITPEHAKTAHSDPRGRRNSSVLARALDLCQPKIVVFYMCFMLI